MFYREKISFFVKSFINIFAYPCFRFVDFVSLDCDVAGIEYIDAGSKDSPWGGATIQDSLIVGHSQLINSYEVSTSDQSNCTTYGVHLPFSSRLTVTNVTFVNFDKPWCQVFGTCAHCKDDDGGAIVRINKLELVSSPNKVSFPWSHASLIYDLDGTLTGIQNGVVLPTSGYLDPAKCAREDAYSFGGIDGSVCDSLKFARVTISEMLPESIKEKQAYLTNDHGSDVINYRFKSKTDPKGWTSFLPISECDIT